MPWAQHTLPAWLRGPSFHSSSLPTPPASSDPSSRIHWPGWWPSQHLLWSPGDPQAGVNIRCSAPKPLEGRSRTPIQLARVCLFTPPGDSSAALPLPHPIIQPSASSPVKWGWGKDLLQPAQNLSQHSVCTWLTLNKQSCPCDHKPLTGLPATLQGCETR